jgi:PII-like signaling protein
MKLPEQGKLLRIFIGEGDKYNGKPLYEVIVLKARELNLAGATVLKGIMGFGANSRLHTSKVLRLSEDMPLIIEIVDTEEKLAMIMPFLEKAVTEGLITIEAATVIIYRHKEITQS